MDQDVDIRHRLERELTESKAPPLGSLVADAVSKGKRLRARRRLAMSATAAATVLVLSVSALVASNLGVAGSALEVPGAGPIKATPTVAPVATPSLVLPPGHKVTTGQAVVALLIASLPSGGRISELEFYSQDGIVSGGFVYDDGHGKATISAGVSGSPASYGDDVAGMRCPTGSPPGFVCEHTTRPDGVEIRVITMGPYGSDCEMAKCSLKDVRVEVKRLDGVYITTEAFNGPFGQGRAATRPDTLLSVDELIALAMDPRWGLTMVASFIDTAEQTIRHAKR